MQNELEHVRAVLSMHEDLDDLIEKSLQSRHGLAQFTSVMLPLVAERIGAKGMMLQTYGESLSLETFAWGVKIDLGDIAEKTGEGSDGYVVAQKEGKTVLAQRLDVAGEWFGRAVAIFDKPIEAESVATLLNAACEELDNFLYAIRAARQKHITMMQLGDALRSRILADGLQQAADVLAKAIPMERMLLVYVAEESNVATLHVQLFEGNKAVIDTMKGRVDPAILDDGRKYLRGESNALLARFGFTSAQEEVLINGVTHSVIVGKVLVTSKTGAFNTWDRELLAGFAGFVRQRIVDFNKEWRRLAASFRSEDVARLVQQDDYEARFLAPREEIVAILYVDISGFTRISEQVLKTPKKVADLVESWSERAVDLVWKHGGVFDKMVGDCIIALFGPPFYEQPKGDRLASAIRCAVEIREMTRDFPNLEGFEILKEGGIGVSTGVNLAPLMVGSFGKNSNFTGFSSGMNNTARLQGCAKKDEILVMQDCIGDLPTGHGFTFGDEQSAAVKNVAVPLRFRALVR